MKIITTTDTTVLYRIHVAAETIFGYLQTSDSTKVNISEAFFQCVLMKHRMEPICYELQKEQSDFVVSLWDIAHGEGKGKAVHVYMGRHSSYFELLLPLLWLGNDCLNNC
jgi:hypothetical protein